jgi:hypothetical protein
VLQSRARAAPSRDADAFLQWVSVLSSTASVTVAPLQYPLFDLTTNFSSTSGVVTLPALSITVTAVPGLSSSPRTLRIIALEGSSAKYWAEASGKAPYNPLESIGAEAAVQLSRNTAAVAADGVYVISAVVSAWAQPTFILLVLCDGVAAVVDAVPPAFLKPGVLLPPPVFTMPQLALPDTPLTFDTTVFPSSLAEAATFSMKVTLPSAGLPKSLVLQGEYLHSRCNSTLFPLHQVACWNLCVSCLTQSLAITLHRWLARTSLLLP